MSMNEIEIEFLDWVHPSFGIMPAKVEGDKPLVLRAKIKQPHVEPTDLTDEEIKNIFANQHFVYNTSGVQFGRDIIAAYKKKNK